MHLDAFDYQLPENLIAQRPLEDRAQSKLIVYKGGEISHSQFSHINHYLPVGSHLFLNNTRVIPARLLVQKSTGANIEIFLLNPAGTNADISVIMANTDSTVWQCLIGNKKRWKDGEITKKITINGKDVTLTMTWHDRDADEIQFNWNNEAKFAELVEAIGNVPLPPYINRAADETDSQRYQTVYSSQKGAVAAPTAGLHFTEPILKEITQQGHTVDELTLHVGAGTFLPITSDEVRDHKMHEEQISVRYETIEKLATYKNPVIPVGTTSMRTLESLYWLGVQYQLTKQLSLNIYQDFAYQHGFKDTAPSQEVFQALLEGMRIYQLDTLVAQTGIYIYPGYQFQVCNGLITNFHQPKSSLIVLVSTLIGEDWKKLYKEAVKHQYRFLSYGDSSLLLPN